MGWNAFATVFAGVLFGAALTVAGVWLPEVIIGQMQLEDFYMLKVFLTGTTVSAIVLFFYERNGLLACKPKAPASYGLFHRYDGNIIGGLLQGASMTLTGACPGTIIPQIIIGHPSNARMVLLGGVLGGIIFTRVSPWLDRSHWPPSEGTDNSMPAVPRNPERSSEYKPPPKGIGLEGVRSKLRTPPSSVPDNPFFPNELTLSSTLNPITPLGPFVDICNDPPAFPKHPLLHQALPSPPTSWHNSSTTTSPRPSPGLCPVHSQPPPPPSIPTLPSILNISHNRCLALYLLLTSLLVATLCLLAPPSADQQQTRLNPFLGGLAIGAAQFGTVTLIRLPVGMSLAYEEAGAWVWYMLGSTRSGGAHVMPRWQSLTFAAGMAIGALITARAVNVPTQSDGLGAGRYEGPKEKVAKVLQGAVMIIGARMAGGCPSGHGISGMAMLWSTSVVTVVAIFAGGVGMAGIVRAVQGVEGRVGWG